MAKSHKKASYAAVAMSAMQSTFEIKITFESSTKAKALYVINKTIKRARSDSLSSNADTIKGGFPLNDARRKKLRRIGWTFWSFKLISSLLLCQYLFISV
jgi:hypothetical protein